MYFKPLTFCLYYFVLADGSFQVGFKKDNTMTIKYRLAPQMNITQNVNTPKSKALFEIVSETLSTLGLTVGKSSHIGKSQPIKCIGNLKFWAFKATV